MKSPDYSKCKIYRIVCNDIKIKETYIGHTSNWVQRKCDHKKMCNSMKDSSYKYKFIKEHGGWYNWSMLLVEDYPCENKLQAEQRERYWIENEKNPLLNIYTPAINSETFRKSKALRRAKKKENDAIDEWNYIISLPSERSERI
jgi:hypothetical protein